MSVEGVVEPVEQEQTFEYDQGSGDFEKIEGQKKEG